MTTIKEIGGEFALINRVVKKIKNKEILVGPGDDAAVIKIGNKYVVWTTDALVENDHFNLKWFTPNQVGKKAIEINVSDVIAMGATPKFALISIVLRKNTKVQFVDQLYNGIYQAAKKYNLNIVGGNFTHGKNIVINISMIGIVDKKNLKRRSAAKPGDFILVSGDLGQSTAGLNLFRKKIHGFNSVKKKHINPEAKPNKIKKFLGYINAMQDISDGLASEVQHICKASKVGAIIYKDNIPIKEDTRKAAKKLKMDEYDFALYGGEDFELVYTVSKKNLGKVRGFLIGEITKGKSLKLYSKGNNKKLVRRGYDHFT